MKCEVCVDGLRLEHALEFKYLGCVLDESRTDEAECIRKVGSGRRVTGAIKFLVNARSLQLECAKVLHESMLVPILTYGSETIWRERSRVTAVQMDNLKGLQGIMRMDKFPNPQIGQLYGVTKGVDENIVLL